MDQGDAGWMNELQERRAHGEIATMERERRLFQKLRQHAAVGSTSQASRSHEPLCRCPLQLRGWISLSKCYPK